MPGSTSQVPLGAWEVHFGCSLLPPAYIHPHWSPSIRLVSPADELYTAEKDLTSQVMLHVLLLSELPS